MEMSNRYKRIREGVYEPTTVSNNKVDDNRVQQIIDRDNMQSQTERQRRNKEIRSAEPAAIHAG